jgi:hypothetical protein
MYDAEPLVLVDVGKLPYGHKDAENESNRLHQGLSEGLAVETTNYDPEIDKLANQFKTLWMEFSKHPELLEKYDGSIVHHQRGTRDGMVRPTADVISDRYRKQIMIGPELLPDNPLVSFREEELGSLRQYLPNIEIEEDDFRDLIPLGVKYMERLNEHDRLVNEGIERALDLPRGYIAARLAWPNIFLRGLSYHIEGEVVATGIVNGYPAFGADRVDGIGVVHIRTSEGEIVNNVVEINAHKDTDWKADLHKIAGAVYFKGSDGKTRAHHGQPGRILVNPGTLAIRDTTHLDNNKEVRAHYQGGTHWAPIEGAVAGEHINSIGGSMVTFEHPMPTSPSVPYDIRARQEVRRTYAIVDLTRMIITRGHVVAGETANKLDSAVRKAREVAEVRLPYREMFEKLLKHEHKQGIIRLRHYEKNLDELMDHWDQAG